MTMNIYWNEEYCAPQTDFETFQKSRHIAKQLGEKQDGLIAICDPENVSGALATAQRQIEKYTDTTYLQAVMTGRPRSLASGSGFEWDEGVYRSVLNSTAGVLCAIDDLIDGEYVASGSLSSGLHHANATRGNGFCTINSLAIGALYAHGRGKKVAILDLDAHCGGGTNSLIMDTTVAQFDLSTSNFDNYRHANPWSCKSLTDAIGTGYLEEVEKMVASLLAFGPEIVLYNAGVDVSPRIDPFIVAMRDRYVSKKLCEDNRIKTMIVPAGGYGDYEQVAWQHTQTYMAFAKRDSAVPV